MLTQVGKWGNSLAVRIPGAVVKEFSLSKGLELEVTRVADGLFMRPRKRRLLLDELLARVAPENIPGETDWGGPVGRETW